MVKKKTKSKKKLLNPFKLWGSYVGVVVGIVLVILTDLTRKLVDFIDSNMFNLDNVGNAIFVYVIVFLALINIGFFIGYWLHLLIRRIRKW